MTPRFSVTASDRSEHWILVPGVASTRQIEIRNESDALVECHVRVEQPPSASASPAILTIQPHHARTADIILLASWLPEQENALIVKVRNPQGQELAVFTQELIAAESSDCALALELKDPVLVEDTLAGFRLWLSIASRSATPRRFEIDFMPHPSLRFPERATVTLAPGEATAFEVPVEWNRSVRDLHFWNHPLKIEAFVPVSRGRRTATLAWEIIEGRLGKYLTEDDKVARMTPVPRPAHLATPLAQKTPGQLKYTELIELKKLEQAVVGASPVRATVQRRDEGLTAKPAAGFPIAPVASTAIALVALGLGAFFFLRPPAVHPATAPVRVSAPQPPTPVLTTRKSRQLLATGPVAKPVWTNVASVSRAAVAAVDSSKESVVAPVHPQAPKAVALAPRSKPAPRPTIDRSAVVELTGVDATYTHGGRAVSVAWTGSAQASATVEVMDATGKIIASRTVQGGRSSATVSLPRGYRGSLSVEVIAFGYHGERVVQSASL